MDKFYVAGFWGEGAIWMLKELEDKENCRIFPDDFKRNLIWKVIFRATTPFLKLRGVLLDQLVKLPYLLIKNLGFGTNVKVMGLRFVFWWIRYHQENNCMIKNGNLVQCPMKRI